ncbi:MAG: hypothetical protein MUF18_06695 [Fimbriiglobus sp.]|nr:hypothetical protein [Fimbriiglobus sp.]
MSVASVQPAASLPEVRYPFGLPLGTIRATLALMICGFVWLVLLWPHDNVKLPLAHFFMGSMVFMAFVSHPGVPTTRGESTFLPWLLRAIFAIGSLGVVAYAVYTDWDQVTKRLVPSEREFKDWWLLFLGVTVGGFLLGRFLRLIMGNGSPFFQSLRAWLSVLAMFMILGEFLLFIAFASSEQSPGVDQFFHAWQGAQLVAVSAYFGSRS